MYIDDRPTDNPPTCSFGKFQVAISQRQVIQPTSCLILAWGFLGRRIEWRYSRFDEIKIQDSGRPPSSKIQMVISPPWVIWSTPCLFLE